jgi:hypothetical protein
VSAAARSACDASLTRTRSLRNRPSPSRSSSRTWCAIAALGRRLQPAPPVLVARLRDTGGLCRSAPPHWAIASSRWKRSGGRTLLHRRSRANLAAGLRLQLACLCACAAMIKWSMNGWFPTSGSSRFRWSRPAVAVGRRAAQQDVLQRIHWVSGELARISVTFCGRVPGDGVARR